MVVPVVIGAARVGTTAVSRGARTVRVGADQRRAVGRRRGAPSAAPPPSLPFNQTSNPTASRILGRRLDRQAQAKDKEQEENATKKSSLLQRAVRTALPFTQTTAQPKKKQNVVVSAVQTAKATAVAIPLSILYLPFWGVQAFSALVYHLAEFIAEESWFGFLLPIEMVQIIAWGICAIIGVIFFIKAVLVFVVSGTNVYKDSVVLSGFLLFTLHLAPYFFFFPWVLIWIWVVVWSQHTS